MDNIITVQELECRIKKQKVLFSFAKRNGGYKVYCSSPIFQNLLNTNTIFILGRKVTNLESKTEYSLNEDQKDLISKIVATINAFHEKLDNS
jgi:hypothetical protein